MIDRTEPTVSSHSEPPNGNSPVTVMAVSHDDGLRVLVHSAGEALLDAEAARSLAASLLKAADQVT